MNAFRKFTVVLIAFAIFAAAFGVAPQQPQAADAQGGSLVIWHSWRDAELELLETWIADFTAENDVEVEARFIPFDDLRTTYENAAGSGEGPDLLIGQADWAGGLADADLILPIDDLIAGTELDTQLTEAAWGTMSYDGNRYGTSVTSDGVALYYNTDLIAADDVPEDLEDLIEAGLELTEGDDVGLLFNTGFYQSVGIYFALGGELFSPEGENLWNTNEAAETFLTIHQTVFEEAPELISGDNALFLEGRAAMIVDGSWNLGQYKEQLGDSLGVALLPNVDGEPWSPFFGGKGFYINSTSENLEEAVAFLTLATSETGAAQGVEIAGHIPTNANIELEDALVATFAEQFAIGTPLPTNPAMNAYWGPLGDAIIAVTEGGETPADAAAAAEATILETLAPAEDDMGEDDMSEDDMDDMDEESMGNIIETAEAAGNFSTLLTAVEAAGLTETLSGEGPFTVFAPSDEVFAALPDGTLEAVLADPDLLTSILLYHVVEGYVDAEAVMGLESATTVEGSDITIEIVDGGVVLNGEINVVVTDIVTSNGVIHVIDGVLVP